MLSAKNIVTLLCIASAAAGYSHSSSPPQRKMRVRDGGDDGPSSPGDLQFCKQSFPDQQIWDACQHDGKTACAYCVKGPGAHPPPDDIPGFPKCFTEAQKTHFCSKCPQDDECVARNGTSPSPPGGSPPTPPGGMPSPSKQGGNNDDNNQNNAGPPSGGMPSPPSGAPSPGMPSPPGGMPSPPKQGDDHHNKKKKKHDKNSAPKGNDPPTKRR